MATKKKEVNTSLSARIRRRNKCGFLGIGTGHLVDADGNIMTYSTRKAVFMGNYRDLEQNHKDIDKANDMAHKSRVDFRIGESKFLGRRSHSMSKKYADNHQRAH